MLAEIRHGLAKLFTRDEVRRIAAAATASRV
jgi:hypothetical protein